MAKRSVQTKALFIPEVIPPGLPKRAYVIRDIGHDAGCKTITNDAENVVKALLDNEIIDPDQRIFYYDSMGRLDELVHDGKEFRSFRPGPPELQPTSLGE